MGFPVPISGHGSSSLRLSTGLVGLSGRLLANADRRSLPFGSGQLPRTPLNLSSFGHQ